MRHYSKYLIMISIINRTENYHFAYEQSIALLQTERATTYIKIKKV